MLNSWIGTRLNVNDGKMSHIFAKCEKYVIDWSLVELLSSIEKGCLWLTSVILFISAGVITWDQWRPSFFIFIFWAQDQPSLHQTDTGCLCVQCSATPRWSQGRGLRLGGLALCKGQGQILRPSRIQTSDLSLCSPDLCHWTKSRKPNRQCFLNFLSNHALAAGYDGLL